MSTPQKPGQNTTAFLNALNQDIEKFIRDAVDTSFDMEKWSSLSKQFEPIHCWNVKGCEKKECPAYKSEDYRCWLTVGTFCGGTIQGEFAKKYGTCFECDVFRAITDQPARRLYENINTLISFLKDKAVKLHQLAIRDPLTRLYNRHFFNEVIEREAARCARTEEQLSFIMIDLDNFKRINDTLGHLTGDSILVETAGILKNTVRETDLVFRFGGDEFLILMMNADNQKSSSMAERLLNAVEKWNRESSDAFGCNISFSMGCATHGKSAGIHSALKEADERMYLHKKTKRLDCGT